MLRIRESRRAALIREPAAFLWFYQILFLTYWIKIYGLLLDKNCKL